MRPSTADPTAVGSPTAETSAIGSVRGAGRPGFRRVAHIVAVATLALLASQAGVATTAASVSAADRTVIADGHVDIGPRMVDDRWVFQARDDNASPPRWRDIGSIVLHVQESSRITVPDGDGYAFLGEAGSPVYVLPQVQRAGLVWPGWNTQDPSVVDGVRGDVTWTLRGVDGPGEFNLFVTDSFGQASAVFDGAKAFPQATRVRPNTHAHGNWSFSEPGIYQLEMSMSGTTQDGDAVTDTRTLVLAVATDPGAAPPASSGGGSSGAGAGGGSGSGSAEGERSQEQGGSGSGGTDLPNTGDGYVLPVAAGALVVLLGGVGLRVGARRRAARSVGSAP
ncbi:MAG: TIGR03773 family transporter-associated surface protein [Angustibacter sp.]